MPRPIQVNLCTALNALGPPQVGFQIPQDLMKEELPCSFYSTPFRSRANKTWLTRTPSRWHPTSNLPYRCNRANHSQRWLVQAMTSQLLIFVQGSSSYCTEIGWEDILPGFGLPRPEAKKLEHGAWVCSALLILVCMLWLRQSPTGSLSELGVPFVKTLPYEPYYLGSILQPLIFGNSQVVLLLTAAVEACGAVVCGGSTSSSSAKLTTHGHLVQGSE